MYHFFLGRARKEADPRPPRGNRGARRRDPVKANFDKKGRERKKITGQRLVRNFIVEG